MVPERRSVPTDASILPTMAATPIQTGAVAAHIVRPDGLASSRKLFLQAIL